MSESFIAVLGLTVFAVSEVRKINAFKVLRFGD